MKLFTYATFISWIFLGLIGKLISNYPDHVIIAFTFIASLWIGLIIYWVFRNSNDSNNGSGGDDGSYIGACSTD